MAPAYSCCDFEVKRARSSHSPLSFLPSHFHHSPLLELIRTSNNDTYIHAISKHSLRSLAAQEDKDDAKMKREVAERYVLANVAGNR